MVCRCCGHHRPGINDAGICPSCVRFGKTAPPTVSEGTSPRPAKSYRKCRSCGKPSRSIGKYGLCATCLGVTKCPRCAGRGFIPRYQHINGGQCGLCGGTGRADRYKAALETAALQRRCSFDTPFPAKLGVITQLSGTEAVQIIADESSPQHAAEQSLTPPPPAPPKLDKVPVVEAALGDELSYEQIRAVLDSYFRYDFSAEELELLRDCERIELAKRFKVATSPMAVHSGQDWWSRDR